MDAAFDPFSTAPQQSKLTPRHYRFPQMQIVRAM